MEDLKKIDERRISANEFDALREVGNVGVGNATTALSKLLNRKIDINIPETKFIKLQDFSYELGNPEEIIVGLYLQFTGDVSGQCLFAFSEEAALELVDLMMGNPSGTSKKLEELEESAFMEMSNIFTGAYLSALANMLSMKIFPSIPNIANDMLQSVVDSMLIQISKSADEVLSVKAKISMEGHNIIGRFMIVFEKESLFKMLEVLYITYGLERSQ